MDSKGSNASLTHATVDADPVFGIEIHGLDPIPTEDRHGSPVDLLWTWLGGNFNYVTLTTGALTIIFGLALWQALIAVVIGSILGAVVLGLAAVFGPRTATATIVNTRAAFGLNGNFPVALISWLSVSGWVAVNSVLAILALIELASVAGLGTGFAVKVAAIVIVLTGQVGIALFGHATVMASEKVFFWVSAVLLLGLMIFAFPKLNWNQPQGQLAGSTVIGTWLLALSVIFAGPISWVNYASDYSRYLPRNTSLKQIIFWTAAGMAISSAIGAAIGSVLATTVDMSNPIANLPKILPGWYLVPFLIVVIWGATANNVLNLYTAGLGLLALRVAVPRWLAVCLVGIIATVLTAIAIFGYNFMNLYAEWLSLTLILLTPWAAILLTDYVLRRGDYDVNALHSWGSGSYWYRGGISWAALGIYLVGVLAAFSVANSTLWTSPVSTHLLGGADLSLFAGLIVTSILYYIVMRSQIRAATAHASGVAAAKQ
jgi:nucleobase:cation symporter-1, NCS1 family